MTFSPGLPTAQPFAVHTHNFGMMTAQQTPGLGNAWPTANLVIYSPLRILSRVIVRKLWFANQATATGNIDIGLYDAGGTKLVSSGSTAKAATNDEQVLDVTDTTIGPGFYYMALTCSNNTDTFMVDADAAPLDAAVGMLTETPGAFGLPTTASWAIAQTLAYNPMMGVLLDTTVT